ncbi:hypothetical protein P8625_01150 [Tenacibaculum tangerinum]|uniref:Uncharacterized protein n=1 Tax=Tenacibaculum tangerinum TaxID=3038772 RepID=A0ABY8L3G3_9FLAO|nr:hypothetical protein [Tenacibaculum tangerinum]WGH75799.1 hypothetical protein P8625_01150 [Tenacibaculum tangerinum]
MISTLRKKSIQKVYDKLVVKEENTQHKETKVKSVAILLDNEALVNVVIANLTNIFPFQKTDIRVLVYKEYSKKEEPSPEFFTEKDIGFKASLKSDNLKDFVKNNYDLLINYTKTSNLITNMVTLLSQADFKAGFAEIDDRLYDIVVADASFNEAVLNQELKKYLTILNKI